METKQRERQRLRESYFKIEILFIVITSRLFLLFQYVKYVTVSQHETDMNCVKVWRGNGMFIMTVLRFSTEH